jgi:hypothetical protein
MKKRYCACVVNDMTSYFEEKLDERKDKIEIICAIPAFTKNATPVVYYVLEAEEGVIDSKWEL